ncbi:hypothetical protein [Flectobacillus roseus]|uniref:Uncharacterized protein n=1 Tax=Flectobacillus roseus TaxID=502259 RepID=A0ABT6Y2L8_9BACT|nr:hypothetical protein [Flectobacillus roseus]MDI9857809.1 hypothetical protein [Flectobacillus roseus]MDI9869462.1 hypothetical protein [Flectobacillus roseus]
MNQHLEDIAEIRAMMERSTRFLSLSGLSGVFAGTFGLIASGLAYFRISRDYNGSYNRLLENQALLSDLVKIGVSTLVLTLIAAFVLTYKRVKKNKQTLWNTASKRLLANLMLPLVAGGLFCIILLQNAPHLIDSATLLFYGLALINASKYTYNDIRYLGIAEVVLGIISGFMNDYYIGLFFWAFGFGVLHILYGILLYRKYEN